MKLLTVKETATALRVSPALVYRLAAEGKLPAVRVGARLLFSAEKLEADLTAQLGRQEQEHEGG